MPLTAIREFLKLEAAGGILLVIAAVLALVLANSPLAWLYNGFLDIPVQIQVGALVLSKPLLLWINDGLMAVFFFLVGLEIKREVLEGELSSRATAALPAVGAVGGMVLPAVIYVVINLGGEGDSLNGWAIPAATDIAFALGVLSLLGPRIPLSLKVFLLGLAIIDDLGAIVIIAVFYTANLSVLSLLLALAGLIGLFVLNRFKVVHAAPYILIGIFIWVCVLKSGVHATLAGVAVALFIPLKPNETGGSSLLKDLEHNLHFWVAFGIMPLFAFANAGVSFAGVTLGSLIEPVPLGILLGLFVGKQIGVVGCVYGAVRLGWCRLPSGVGWPAFYGVAMLTGIGFTMSLFIGTLAFESAEHSAGIRLGVLGGSLLSGIGGYLVLRLAGGQPTQAEEDAASLEETAEEAAG